jgi:CrcB protein
VDVPAPTVRPRSGAGPSARRGRVAILVAVFAGGALGTLLRAAFAELAPHDDPSAWPWATFAVNLAGAFLLGYWATRLLLRAPDVDPRVRPFLATGLCGGLTTFSTLQLELVELVRADAWATAVAYVGLSVVLGLAAVLAGRAVAGRVPWGSA